MFSLLEPRITSFPHIAGPSFVLTENVIKYTLKKSSHSLYLLDFFNDIVYVYCKKIGSVRKICNSSDINHCKPAVCCKQLEILVLARRWWSTCL